MRKTITLMMALAVVLLMSGLAEAQIFHVEQYQGGTGTIVPPDQDDSSHEMDGIQRSLVDNYVALVQHGEDDYAKLRQRSASGSSWATICQFGDDLRARVRQDGDGDNNAYVYQKGHNSDITVDQYGFRPPISNSATVKQLMTCGTTINIEQQGGATANGNTAEAWQMFSMGSKIDVKQTKAKFGNDVTAHQMMAFNSRIDVDQRGVGFGNGRNVADLHQKGAHNKARADQESANNDLTVWQMGCGNKVDLVQRARGMCRSYNDADINQFGHGNKVVGASTEEVSNGCCGGCCGGVKGTTTVAVVAECRPATQIACGYNELTVNQCGSGNTLGLYQNARCYNEATVNQYNGDNTLAVYQDNPNGYNIVNVTQYGGQTAQIHQTNHSGGLSVVEITQGTI